MNEIDFQIDSHNIGILIINRPHVHNALNWTAMQAFADAIEQAHEAAATLGRGLRALIITGAGPSFVSGGDINELQAYPTKEDGLRLATIMGNALARLEALPCITIAAINGPARGVGAEIAVACDLRVMDEVADIGFVQVRMGISTAWGGGQRLLRAIGYSRALELMATGRVISAADALGLRLVNLVTAAGEACTAARHLAEQIAANPPDATQAAKRILRFSQTHPDGGTAFDAERAEFPGLWDTEFRREAVRKFLNRNK